MHTLLVALVAAFVGSQANEIVPHSRTFTLVCTMKSVTGKPFPDRTYTFDEDAGVVSGNANGRVIFSNEAIRWRQGERIRVLIHRYSGKIEMFSVEFGLIVSGQCEKAVTQKF